MNKENRRKESRFAWGRRNLEPLNGHTYQISASLKHTPNVGMAFLRGNEVENIFGKLFDFSVHVKWRPHVSIFSENVFLGECSSLTAHLSVHGISGDHSYFSGCLSAMESLSCHSMAGTCPYFGQHFLTSLQSVLPTGWAGIIYGGTYL